MNRVIPTAVLSLSLGLTVQQSHARPTSMPLARHQSSLSTRSISSQSSLSAEISAGRPPLMRSDVAGQRLLSVSARQPDGRPGLARSDSPGRRVLQTQASAGSSKHTAASVSPLVGSSKRQRTDYDALKASVDQYKQKVSAFHGDCCTYRRQVKSQHPLHPSFNGNPYGVGPVLGYGRAYKTYDKARRPPLSELGKAIEKHRANNPEKRGNPALDNFLLAKFGTPLYRFYKDQRLDLVTDVNAARKSGARPREDYRPLRQDLVVANKTLDAAYYQIYRELPPLKVRFRRWAKSFVAIAAQELRPAVR